MPRRALPPRYPPTGTWPAQMRADMAAAYLDYRDTTEFAIAIRRGDAPPPSSLRGSGRKREPVWCREELDRYLAPAPPDGQNDERAKEDLRLLV